MSGLAFASSQVRLVSVQREAGRRRTTGVRRAVTRSFNGRPQCREAAASFAGRTRKLLCQASKDSQTAATECDAPREVNESSSWNPLLASTALWLLSESAAHAEGVRKASLLHTDTLPLSCPETPFRSPESQCRQKHSRYGMLFYSACSRSLDTPWQVTLSALACSS